MVLLVSSCKNWVRLANRFGSVLDPLLPQRSCVILRWPRSWRGPDGPAEARMVRGAPVMVRSVAAVPGHPTTQVRRGDPIRGAHGSRRAFGAHLTMTADNAA